jgi:ABC-type antimicrobial peptide transport system permease subunit
MQPTNEKLFYDALADVPDVPLGILAEVERRAKRSGVKRRISLAACFLLAFIVPALVLTQINTTASAVYANDNIESMDELLYAFEFFTGSFDIDYLFDDSAYETANNTSVAPDSGIENSRLIAASGRQAASAEKELSNEN